VVYATHVLEEQLQGVMSLGCMPEALQGQRKFCEG
jgi:hypothetical protein